MNTKNLAILIAIVGTTLAFATAATIAAIPYAHAAQSCDQRNAVVGACVNANVAKNNICVGVLSQTQRCIVP